MPQRMSKQHKVLRNILRGIFLNLSLKDEHAVRWQGKAYLLDLYVPQFNIAFEIQGRQHAEYVPFFHGNKGNFTRQKKLDVEKVQACIANGIKLIYIYHTDKIDANFILSLIQGDDDERIVTREHNPDASSEQVDGADNTG